MQPLLDEGRLLSWDHGRHFWKLHGSFSYLHQHYMWGVGRLTTSVCWTPISASWELICLMLLPLHAAGYVYPIEEILDELVYCLDHPALPLLQWNEEFSFVESRLPSGLGQKLEQVIEEHDSQLRASSESDAAERPACEFPGRALIKLLREAVAVSVCVCVCVAAGGQVDMFQLVD